MELFIELDALKVHECVMTLPYFFPSFYSQGKRQSHRMLAKERHIYVSSQDPTFSLPYILGVNLKIYASQSSLKVS